MIQSNQKVGPKDARLKSKGCLTCIRMKVKCDENKPHCDRCKRGRRRCPGYRGQATDIFRYEKHNYHGNKTKDVACDPAQHAAASNRSPRVPLPSTDWSQVALAHYFDNWVCPSVGTFPGYFEKLPQVYAEHAHVPYFRNSIEAVSLASLARIRCMGERYLHDARRAYVLAMRDLGPVLKNPDEAGAITVLVTVEMLLKFDIVMGEDNLGMGSPHRRGQLEILRVRLSQKLDGHTQMNRNALANVRMQFIALPPGGLSNDEAKDLTVPTPPATLMTPSLKLLLVLLPQVAAACGQDPDSKRCKLRADAISDQVNRLQLLDEELQQWCEDLPDSWRLKPVPNPATYREDELPHFLDTLFVMPHAHLASVWIPYWLARLEVLRSVAVLLPAVVDVNSVIPALLDTHSAMLAATNSICAAAPNLLGHITDDGKITPKGSGKVFLAFFLTRALYTASRIPGLPAAQRDWIRGRLEYIGWRRGLGDALVLRDQISLGPEIM